MRFINDPINFSNAALSASRNSDATPVFEVFNASVQVVVTDSGSGVVGTLKLQFSNDKPLSGQTAAQRSAAVTNWTDITNQTAAVSAAGTFGFLLENIGYEWVRVVYTRTSGNGTIAARIAGKGV